MEEIPYKETRGYVKQVLADFVIYQQLYGGPDAPARVTLALPAPKTTGVTF
jgi:soluble lytic murein transglycosylase